MKKTILVLGINGFIGRNLIDYILNNKLFLNFEFIFVGRKIIHKKASRFVKYSLDLTNEILLKDLLVHTKPNYIINLAGVNEEDLSSNILLNAELPRKIMETIISNKLNLDNLLLIGSAAEYGANDNVPLEEKDELKPLNAYGLSKVIQTNFFNFYSPRLNINLARTFNVIGPYMPTKLSIGSFVEKINNCNDGDSIITGNLTSKRDYLYIDDVIAAFFKILISGIPGEIYNVCSGEAVTMSKIIDDLIVASGKKINVKVNPELVKKVDVPVSYGSNKKLIKDTQWHPSINIKEMLHKLFIKK